MADARSQVDVGCHVTVLTAHGEEVKGEVLAHDDAIGLMTLKQPGSTPYHSNLRMISVDHIRSIVDIEPGKEESGRLSHIDPRRCQEREERAVAAAELEAAKVGVDVSAEAQAIFNGLAKTLPCKWRGATIVVLDEVSIVPPYDAASCTQLAPNAKLFDRIQTVLSNERSKLGLK